MGSYVLALDYVDVSKREEGGGMDLLPQRSLSLPNPKCITGPVHVPIK